MKKRITAIGAVLFIAALVLAACGGGGGGNGNTTSIKVDTNEFAFNPADVTVPAGANVSLTLTNSGSVEHTWVILKQGVDLTTSVGMDQSSVYFAAKVESGQTTTMNFTAPATAGDYEIICDLPGHLEGGMKGTLTVK
jgi:plastocyanin